jgi:primosomal replication protein N
MYLKGIVVSPFELYYAAKDKTFYRGYIEVLSISGISNRLPIVTDEKLIKELNISVGSAVKINANLRTRNYKENGVDKVDVYAFAYDIKPNNKNSKYTNQVTLEGYICKLPQVRYSPTGDKLYSTILANNRENGIVNYIPIVFFEKNSKEAEQIEVGDLIQLKGRFQSRTYWKNKVLKTVYEVAILTFQEM